MRDDFGNDREEYMDLRPAFNDKKFSAHLWNNRLLPVARKLIKQRGISRLRAGFDSSRGKEYCVTVWLSRGYDYGGVFTIQPLSGNDVHVTCRDLQTNEFTEGGCWDFVLEAARRLKEPAHLLAHKR